MKARALLLLSIAAACRQTEISDAARDDGGQLGNQGQPDAGDNAGAGNGADAGEETTGTEAGAGGEASAVELALPALCTSDTQTPPKNLVCTGLYADIVAKRIAPGVEAYAPAATLWSDGAAKQRWIGLPPGKMIDNSDANEWKFPVGTRVWKEFSKDGQRVETRLWQKTDVNYWVAATYAWSRDESGAARSGGGDVSLSSGATYHIPTSDECTDCHRGRTDRILGFDQVLLGLAGATGLTLDRLVVGKRLSRPPTSTRLVIGDDGTKRAAPALAWLHVNCGTTCHNQNSNAKAWSTGMFLRLDPTLLDGRPVIGFDSLATTLGLGAVTPAWKGQTRIAPHDPAHSLLLNLITHRGTGQQMPPIASRVIDEADDALVEAWIAGMTAPAIGGGSGGTAGMTGNGEGGRGGTAGITGNGEGGRGGTAGMTGNGEGGRGDNTAGAGPSGSAGTGGAAVNGGSAGMSGVSTGGDNAGGGTAASVGSDGGSAGVGRLGPGGDGGGSGANGGIGPLD